VFLISAWQKCVRRKWFVLAVYQVWKGISAGLALEYFTWFIGAGGQLSKGRSKPELANLEPRTQDDPGPGQVLKLCFVPSRTQKNDVTMWWNCHICTKFQENRHIFGSTEKNFFETWQRQSNLECDKMWRKCDVTSFRHRPSLKPRSRFLEHSGLERPWVRGKIKSSNQYPYVRGPLRECRSIRSGASGLPYYCAPLVCISVVIELLAVWRYNKPKTKNQKSISSYAFLM